VGRKTILLVEDQDEVRNVAQQILRRYGYHVLEASNAGEALLLCEKHPAPDQSSCSPTSVMPQMSGSVSSPSGLLAYSPPDLKVPLHVWLHGKTPSSNTAFLDSGIDYLQSHSFPVVLARPSFAP